MRTKILGRLKRGVWNTASRWITSLLAAAFVGSAWGDETTMQNGTVAIVYAANGEEIGQYTSVADAIAAGTTVSGCTVLVLDGTHDCGSSTIAIDKSITLTGQSKAGTVLNFTANGVNAFAIAASNVTVKDMTIDQADSGTYNTKHVTVGSASNMPSGITLQNIKFTGGKYSVEAVASNLTIDSCEFVNIPSAPIMLYAVQGTTRITNNTSTQGNVKSDGGMIYHLGLSGNTYKTTGKMLVGGNTSTGGRALYFWQLASSTENLTLDIVNNKMLEYNNKGVVFYQVGTDLADNFDRITITNNVFSSSFKRPAILRDDTDHTLTINANYNYWGRSNPDFTQPIPSSNSKYDIDGENVDHEWWYNTYANGELSDLRPLPAVAQIVRTGDKYETLASAIAAAVDGDTIELLEDIEIAAPTTLNKAGTYVIDGCGYTITKASDASFGSDGALVFNNGNITLKNAIITGFNAEIVRCDGATLTIDNCEFTENNITVNSGRGRHLVRIAYSTVTIQNSAFTDNTAADYGVFYIDEAPNNILVDNCLFASNTVNGVAVFYAANDESAVIVDSTFIGNTVTSTGNAAILYCGICDCSGCLFKDNTVNNTDSGYAGKRLSGAIFTWANRSQAGTTGDGIPGTISGNAFVDNAVIAANGQVFYAKAIYSGGYFNDHDLVGNYFGGTAPVVLQTGISTASTDIYAEFNRNGFIVTASSYATSYTLNDDNYGVTVVMPVVQIVRDDAVVGVYADLQSAFNAAQSGDTIELLKDVVWDGTGSYCQLNASGSVTIDGKGFTLSAPVTGGPTDSAIMLGDSSSSGSASVYTVTNMTFSGFTTISHSVLRAQGVRTTIVDCTFTGNGSTDGEWGVVTANNGANVTVKDCVFSGNTGTKCVDVGFNVATGSSLAVDNCLFENNNLTGHGVIYVAGDITAASVHNSTFSGNTVLSPEPTPDDAKPNAAVVYCSGVTSITGCLFTNNTVKAYGKEGVVVLGSGAQGAAVTGNAFVDNELSTDRSPAHYATLYVSKTCDLSANYWGDGAAPAEADQQDIYNSGTQTPTIDTYATNYTVVGNGVTVTLYVPPVAAVITDNGATTNTYETFAEAISAARANGGTVALLADIDVAGGTSLGYNMSDIVLDGQGYTITCACGVLFSGTNVVVSNLKVEMGVSGNHIMTVTSGTFTGCEFVGASGVKSVDYADDKSGVAKTLTFSYCTFRDFTTDNAVLNDDEANANSQLVVDHCTFSNTVRVAILQRADTFTNNTVTDFAKFTANNTGVVMTGNTFDKGTRNGVMKMYQKPAEISGNDFSATGVFENNNTSIMTADDPLNLVDNIWGDYDKSTLPVGIIAELPSYVAQIIRNNAVFAQYETLALAIAAAVDGDTIELLTDIQLSGTEQVAINKVGTYVIDGKGFAITPASDAGYVYERFKFGMDGEASNFAKSYTITNLTITGFTDSTYFIRNEGCSATFVDCTITNNNLSAQSNSRLVLATASNLTMKDCLVADNTTASYLVDFNTNGSSNGTVGTLDIDGCLFDGNTVGGSGLVYTYGSSSGGDAIRNSTFSGNTVNSAAAAIVYFSGATDVTGCFFTNNTVTATDATQKCGILALGSGAAGIDIAANVFVDNTVASGGAKATVYVGATNVDLTGNYWGGSAPVVDNGADVYIYSGKSATYENYAVAYAVNESGNGVTVTLYVPPVAQIVGGDTYTTLQAAVDAAESGDTVKLLADIAMDGPLNVSGKTFTIDLDGNQVSLKTGVTNIIDADVTIVNGMINIDDVSVGANNAIIEIKHGKSLTLDGVTLEGEAYSAAYGVFYARQNATLNVTNCTFTLENDLAHATGGVFKGDYTDSSLFNITDSTLNFTDAVRGFAVCKAVITGSDVSIVGSGNGTGLLDNAINRVDLTLDNSNVTISGGTGRGLTLRDGCSTVVSNGSTLTISGMGEGDIQFQSDDTLTVSGNSTVSAGTVVLNSSTTETVDNLILVDATSFSPVYEAQIGRTLYKTLAEALDAAVDGTEVIVVRDISLNADIEAIPAADANVTLTQGDYTITANGHAIILSGSPIFVVTTDKQTDAFDAASGYTLVKSGSYVYTPTKIVAMIGETPYTTLADAIAAADEAGVDEITILNGVTESPDAGWKIADGKLVRKAYVAQIVLDGGATTNKYESLETAYSAATSGDVIEMLADYRLSVALTFNKSVTLTGAVDEDGKPKYTIYGNPTTHLPGGMPPLFINSPSSPVDLTFLNLNFSEFGNERSAAAGYGFIYISKNSNADTHLMISNVTMSAFNCDAITAIRGNIEVVDSVIDGAEAPGALSYGIRVGNYDQALNPTLNIVRTEIRNIANDANWSGAAIIAGASSTVTLTDCTITNVSNGVTAIGQNKYSTAAATSVLIENTVINATGWAFDIDQSGFDDQPVTSTRITVTSGMYAGKHRIGPEVAEKAVIAISGGVFDRAVRDEFCATDYICVDNTDESTCDDYPYAVVPAVARITIDDETYYYATFEEAIEAAELEEDVTITVINYNAETMTAPAGWKFVTENDVTTLVKKVYVAQIVTDGGATTNMYESLRQAYDAAENGDTIEMVADDRNSFSTSEPFLRVAKAVTITGAVDEEGYPLYTIYGMSTYRSNSFSDEHCILIVGGDINITISNLKIEEFGNQTGTCMYTVPIWVGSGLTGLLTMRNVHVSKFNRNGVTIQGGNFLIDSCVVDGAKDFGNVFTQGIDLNHTATGLITNSVINNVTKNYTDSYTPFGINQGGHGVVTVVDCQVSSGGTGIICGGYVGAGGTVNTLNVSNCTVVATGGNAIEVSDNSQSSARIYVSGGTYVGGVGVGVEGAAIAVSGGYFDEFVQSRHCATGYLCTTRPVKDELYQVVPAETVTYTLAGGDPEGAALPSPASFAYPSGDMAEIALAPATCTDGDYTFAGWKVSGEGDAIAALPAGTTGDITLVATWTGVKTVTITESATDVPIKVTDEWIGDNVTPAAGTATTKEIQDALNKEEANGNKAWENYVLGLDGSNPNAKLAADAAQGPVSATPITSNVDVPPVDTGFTVEYKLVSVDTNGTAVTESALQPTPDLTADIAAMTSETNVVYYKTVAVITSTSDANVKVEVPSTNTIGVLKVESGAKTTAVAVPWASYDGTNDISVADIVRTANLTPGDELKAYDRETGRYKAWTLSADRAWEPMTVVGGAERSDADAYAVPRGSAVWLTRQDTTQPVYLVGGVAATEKAEVTLDAGSATEPSWNLVAPSGTEPVDIAELLGDGATADRVTVPTAYVPKEYEYVDGKGWGYWESVAYTDAKGRKRVKREFRTGDTEVPAGTGFWYLNGGDAKSIDL